MRFSIPRDVDTLVVRSAREADEKVLPRLGRPAQMESDAFGCQNFAFETHAMTLVRKSWRTSSTLSWKKSVRTVGRTGLSPPARSNSWPARRQLVS